MSAVLVLSDVECAEPDQPAILTQVAVPPDLPNDTYFEEQWHLRNTGQWGGTIGACIEAPKAWQIEPGSEQVRVAVLDTGIDYDHPELEGRILQGFDFVDQDSDATAVNPHGVFVAGLIAAEANNDFGVAGVCPTCFILPVRVLGAAVGGLGSVFDVVQGIDYATASGVDVINMSLGFESDSVILEAALEMAVDHGIVVICGTGNGGIETADTFWPGASPHVISIGGTDRNDVRIPFSSTGSTVDFVAPGFALATIAKAHTDDFKAFGGTSASAAVASGVAALLKSYNRFLTQAQIYDLLKAGAADQVGDPDEDTPGWDPFHGHGRLSAFRSLQALCSCEAGAQFTVSPPQLKLGEVGTWLFRLSAGTDNALQPYLIVGTLAGTQAPFTASQTTWPLTFDPYTQLCLFGPQPLLGQSGLLDVDGYAEATLMLPGAARVTLAGKVLHHAAAAYDGSLARPLAGPPLQVSDPVAASLYELPDQLFFEDFENGAQGWVFDNGANGQWHIASPGECGASSHRAAYNSRAPSCTFSNGTSGTLISPSFVLNGVAPYRIRFSTVVDLPTEWDSPVLIELVDETPIATLKPCQWQVAEFGEVISGETTYELVVPESPHYEGRLVHLEARCTTPLAGVGQGWWLDDVSVWNSGSD